MLYLVSTPIGNLKDISLRALEILKRADFIVCEDTRKTRKLLSRYKVTARLEVYNDFNKEKQLPHLLNMLQKGLTLALVADAGTPTISDPGFKLVRLALEKNIKVSPIPGPSALISALAMSGQPTDKFVFVGFLPKQSGKRRKLLLALRKCQLPSSAIFYESPFRLTQLLRNLADIFGKEAKVTICREITKLHEETKRGSLEEMIAFWEGEGKVRGEITVILNLQTGEKTKS